MRDEVEMPALQVIVLVSNLASPRVNAMIRGVWDSADWVLIVKDGMTMREYTSSTLGVWDNFFVMSHAWL
jgi:hypothetical protein